jgi:hypothetical protein
MKERLRDLMPLIPPMEFRAVRAAIKEAITYIARLEERLAEQERHLATLRAQLLKKQSND